MTKKEIVDYLGLKEDYDFYEDAIMSALYFQEKYKNELQTKNYGFGLVCDLEVYGRLEDNYKQLQVIEQQNGVAFYKIIR